MEPAVPARPAAPVPRAASLSRSMPHGNWLAFTPRAADLIIETLNQSAQLEAVIRAWANGRRSGSRGIGNEVQRSHT